MRISVSKYFTIDCAHSLPHLPRGHKCRNLHGHTYGITLVCEGEMKGEWLIDYAEIAAAWKPIAKKLDHKNLNELLPCVTTAENFAIWLGQKLRKKLPLLSEIHVRETETSNVIYKLEPNGLLARFMWRA